MCEPQNGVDELKGGYLVPADRWQDLDRLLRAHQLGERLRSAVRRAQGEE